MKICVPEYYTAFCCTASECRHNCCREGWEIEIDDAHASRYRDIASNPENPCSEKLREGVFLPTVRQRKEGLRPRIFLKEDGKCPFLSGDGLCELIKNYGEGMLCRICADHPRFRNYYRDHTETGIGMCCEEAVRLILSSPFPVRYLDLKSGETVIPEHTRGRKKEAYRDALLKKLDIRSWAEYLLSLEHLEPGWAQMLEVLKTEETQKAEDKLPASVWQKIEEYLLYRHLSKDGAEFTAVLSVLLKSMCGKTEIFPGMEPESRLAEILRVFSSEIEYSEEALEAVANRIHS